MGRGGAIDPVMSLEGAALQESIAVLDRIGGWWAVGRTNQCRAAAPIDVAAGCEVAGQGPPSASKGPRSYSANMSSLAYFAGSLHRSATERTATSGCPCITETRSPGHALKTVLPSLYR